MGLDVIELVQSVEREFQITIPNDTAPTLGTLGELQAFVVQSLQKKLVRRSMLPTRGRGSSVS